MEILFRLFFILLVVTLPGLVWFLVKEIQSQSLRKRRRLSQVKSSVPFALEQELLSMLGGNRSTARRLVTSVRRKNPGRDTVWCWEKAISDLERDRR